MNFTIYAGKHTATGTCFEDAEIYFDPNGQCCVSFQSKDSLAGVIFDLEMIMEISWFDLEINEWIRIRRE